MKISSQQKEALRLRLVRAFVAEVSEKGWERSTLRGTTKRAKLGEATIYKYFPTKEHLLTAYYADQIIALEKKVKAIKKWNSYRLVEKLHIYQEGLFDLYQPDKAFVRMTFDRVFFSFYSPREELLHIKARFFENVSEIFNQAIEKGEIPEPPLMGSFIDILWYFQLSVTQYWLRDDTENSVKTTELMDIALDFGMSIIQSNVLGKAWELLGFFIKSHLQDHFFHMTRFKDFFKGFPEWRRP